MELRCFMNSMSKREVQGRRRGRTESRVYVWESKESIVDNLVNRRSRLHDAYKEIVSVLCPGVKLRWSQKAGCSCGCSPGFIPDRNFYDPITHRPYNLHVDVEWRTP